MPSDVDGRGRAAVSRVGVVVDGGLEMVAHVVEVDAVVNVWEVEVIILNGHESEASVLPSVRGTWNPRSRQLKYTKTRGSHRRDGR